MSVMGSQGHRLVHYLPSRQAYRSYRLFGSEFSDGANACNVQGTQRVTMDYDEVTCGKCKHWYWHGEGLQLSPQGAAYVASLGG